jgi:ABC-type multidrug transport system ATPase subunit
VVAPDHPDDRRPGRQDHDPELISAARAKGVRVPARTHGDLASDLERTATCRSSSQHPDLTARENVDFVASLFGILWRTRHRRTREVLELVDLWEVRGRRAGALSGGMQRRLELACAMVHSPALLFLDEPTAGIDPLLRGRIWEELHRLRDAGRTLLVTTQYVGEAESCDTVALISDGRLIALAPPAELRRMAVGGDRVEVVTAGAFDPWSPTPSTRSARSNGGPAAHAVHRRRCGYGSPDVAEAIGAEAMPGAQEAGRHSTTYSRSSPNAARRSRRRALPSEEAA